MNIRYDEALVSADRAVCSGRWSKSWPIARIQSDLHGQALHRAWRERVSHALFAVKDGPERLSTGERLTIPGGTSLEVCKGACGGICLRIVDGNGYRRRAPYTFCPINATWGMDNRSVALRVIDTSEDGHAG